MLSISAKVVSKPDRKMTLVELQAGHCGACGHSCRRRQPLNVEIPGEYDGAVNLRLSAGDQMELLFNSLLLPLISFVFAGSLAQWFESSEPVIIFSATIGLIIGIFLCQRKPSTLIKVQELEPSSYQS